MRCSSTNSQLASWNKIILISVVRQAWKLWGGDGKKKKHRIKASFIFLNYILAITHALKNCNWTNEEISSRDSKINFEELLRPCRDEKIHFFAALLSYNSHTMHFKYISF